MRILFSRNFAYGMFRENKNLAKIYEFTVLPYVMWSIILILPLSVFCKLFLTDLLIVHV